MRSDAVMCRFFFAAKSYVQNGRDVPMLSSGGVVRTGWRAFAGCPSRPRIDRVSSKISARGSGLVRRTWVKSGSGAALRLALGRVVAAADAETSGDGEDVVCGGVQDAATISAAASTTRPRDGRSVIALRTHPAWCAVPPRGPHGDSGVGRAGGCR